MRERGSTRASRHGPATRGALRSSAVQIEQDRDAFYVLQSGGTEISVLPKRP